MRKDVTSREAITFKKCAFSIPGRLGLPHEPFSKLNKSSEAQEQAKQATWYNN